MGKERMETFAWAKEKCPADYTWRQVLLVHWFLTAYSLAYEEVSFMPMDGGMVAKARGERWTILEDRTVLDGPLPPEVEEEGRNWKKGEIEDLLPKDYDIKQRKWCITFFQKHPGLFTSACEFTKSGKGNLMIKTAVGIIVLHRNTGKLLSPAENKLTDDLRKDLFLEECERAKVLLENFPYEDYPFGKYVSHVRITYGGKEQVSFRTFPKDGAYLHLMGRTVTCKEASVWGILEAVIAGLERSSLVPWEKLDSRKVFLEATARIPEYTRCQMTREQGEEARHPMYGAILGPSFGKTAGAFVENGERMDFERTFSGMNDGAQVVFRAGDFSLSVNLMSLKASLGPKAVHLMESFFLLLKHRDMVFAIYQGAVKACGLSNLSFFLKKETLHLKASCPSSFLEKKQKGKEPVAEEAFPLGSAYKRRLSSFLARYKACTIQDKEKGRELPGYGQVLPTVFLYEVARNAKYCTRAAIIKYLRGLTLDESVLENFGHSPYQGAFGLVSTARWEEVCSWLLQQKLIREETVEGNYGSFAILKPENLARYFLYGQEDYYHKKKAEYTEIEMADYIARETLAGKKTSAHIERAQYLAEHPGVYCLAKEGADAYLAGAPEQVGAYLKTLYKLEEDRAMKKYLKELCNACS